MRYLPFGGNMDRMVVLQSLEIYNATKRRMCVQTAPRGKCVYHIYRGENLSNNKHEFQKKAGRPEQKFTAFSISGKVSEALSLLGYYEPTPIQDKVIPILMEGKDVVGKSKTGSGKTAAFGIPLAEKIVWEEHHPQALVLEPTRELAVQVKEELFQIGRNKKIKIPAIFGGMPIDKEIISLKQKSHIVVGTPGRVLDHIERGTLVLSNIKYLIIDEADLMLDMGFLEEVERIMRNIPKKPIVALFSATFGYHIEDLVDHYMDSPERVVIEGDEEDEGVIEQIGYIVSEEDKFQSFFNLLMVENPEDCMIFCQTREMVNVLYQQLKRKGVRCGMLHGAMEQKERLYAIDDFRVGKFHYLVTTDVASRGIDFVNMTHVFNYDFPTNKENYVHRIGRTGRNKKSGKAISLIWPSESRYVEAVEEFTGEKIPMGELPGDDIVRKKKDLFFQKQKEKKIIKEKKGAIFQQTITKISIGGGRKSKMRPGDIVGTLCSIEGITQEDIGIVDVRDSLTYVEIFNGKGNFVLEELQDKTIKGKIRKVQKTRSF